MQRYPVRRTLWKSLTPEAIGQALRAHFETGSEAAGGAEPLVATFGAISRLTARPVGHELEVDVVMNPQVPNDVAGETIRRYNQFLEEVTGFSSKERARRLKKSVDGDGAP